LVVRKLPTYNHKHKHFGKDDRRTGCFEMSDVMCLTRISLPATFLLLPSSLPPSTSTCSLLLVDITNALTFFELPSLHRTSAPPPRRTTPMCVCVCVCVGYTSAPLTHNSPLPTSLPLRIWRWALRVVQ